MTQRQIGGDHENEMIGFEAHFHELIEDCEDA